MSTAHSHCFISFPLPAARRFCSLADLYIFLTFHEQKSWQIGTPWADGTAAISQCAINPEETFTYRFVVDKVLPQFKSSYATHDIVSWYQETEINHKISVKTAAKLPHFPLLFSLTCD
jgi:hypothetical protein